MYTDFDQMTLAERILYLQDLWDRIAAEVEQQPLTPAQAEDLDWRLADYRDNPTNSVPWAVAREEMRRPR